MVQLSARCLPVVTQMCTCLRSLEVLSVRRMPTNMTKQCRKFPSHLKLLLGYVLAAQDDVLLRVVVLLHRCHRIAANRRFVRLGTV